MIRKLRLLLIIAGVLIVAAAVTALVSSRASARRSGEAQAALRKAVEFLKPDTTSDLRFGRGKSSGVAQPTTPAPAKP